MPVPWLLALWLLAWSPQDLAQATVALVETPEVEAQQLGTAAYVDDNHLLTAAHCVASGLEGRYLPLWFIQDEMPAYLKPVVVDRDLDLALLRTLVRQQIPPPTYQDAPVALQVGYTLWSYGTGLRYATLEVSRTDLYLIDLLPGLPLVSYNGPVGPGASGALVYNDQGALISMINGGALREPWEAYGVPAKTIRAFLEHQHEILLE